MANYLIQDYFPSDYFDSIDPLGAELADVSDREAYATIVGLLATTRQFADVLFGKPLASWPASAATSPVAVVVPHGWSEAEDSDPSTLIRSVSYELTLAVRGDDPWASFDQIDRLSCLAQNLLDGADLGGRTLASLTRLGGGRLVSSTPFSDQHLTMHGEFTYPISRLVGRDETG